MFATFSSQHHNFFPWSKKMIILSINNLKKKTYRKFAVQKKGKRWRYNIQSMKAFSMKRMKFSKQEHSLNTKDQYFVCWTYYVG